MKRGVTRNADPALFDQLQAAALNAIREHVVWFVFAVDEKLECKLMISCPENVESDTITGEQLYQILLHNVICAAAEALVDEDELE